MAYGKYLLPVLAAGHLALAQTATGTSDGEYKMFGIAMVPIR